MERWRGLESFIKLLAIPLLLVQFRRSDRGLCVFGGYVVSCVACWCFVSMFTTWPGLWSAGATAIGVPVKNAATQSGEFVTCIFGLLYWRRRMSNAGAGRGWSAPRR